ncbi:integrase, catalytic region, zinc finger, CCHC-type containing protein [Tanacetum coccineum]
MTRNRSQLIKFVDKFLGTVIFGNDHIAKIMGYGDYHMGNVMISWVYYVEGLRHNLFSVRQFCDSDLEVAFRKHTCYIRDLEGVDLLKGLKGSNLYTLSLEDMMLSSPIYLLSKASKTKSKDEAPEFIIKFLKMIHVYLNTTVRNICTDNGTEFVNQTLRSYYEDVRNSYETSVAQAVATTCYTQNRSLICLRHNKTPYELLHDRNPYLTYFHVFGALCYPTNDSKDLGKLKPKADIGIFIGYAPVKKAYQIYNKCTRRIMETVHVDFDEQTAITSKQFDAPSPRTSQTPQKLQSPVIPCGVEEQFHDIEVAHLDNDPFFGVPIPEPNFEESSSRDVIPTNVHSINQPLEHLRKWTKDHPFDNVIGNPSRPIFIRHQLQTKAMFCYFDAFLTFVEPKNYKEDLKESCWIEAM